MNCSVRGRLPCAVMKPNCELLCCVLGVREDRVVQDIVDVHPNLEARALGEAKVLHRGGVEVIGAVRAEIAEGGGEEAAVELELFGREGAERVRVERRAVHAARIQVERGAQ